MTTFAVTGITVLGDGMGKAKGRLTDETGQALKTPSNVHE
jgi:hypothetical protein